MDLTTVKNDLFNFFREHDTLSLDDDFDKIYPLVNKAEKSFHKALIEKALEEFVAGKIVSLVEFNPDSHGEFGYSGISIGNKKTWVLDKPLEQYSQTIELSYPTLLGLTNLINNYCDQVKDKSGKVNPLNVQEKDINSLLLIVHQALTG